jgi:hypothetical protein
MSALPSDTPSSSYQTSFLISNMGSYPSTSRDRISSAERGEIQYAPYAPDEASRNPEDDTSLWPDFWEKASLYPHKDGKSIIIWGILDDDLGPNPRARPGWPIKRLRKAYEILGEDHPRVVRCVILILFSDALLTSLAI